MKRSAFIYVLELDGGFFYVGRTYDLNRRIQQHFSSVGYQGCEWTRLHKPRRVFTSRPERDSFDEDVTTKRLMLVHGIDRVRGGVYCQLTLPETTHLHLERELRGITNRCYSCGNQNHFMCACPFLASENKLAVQTSMTAQCADIILWMDVC